MNFERMIIKNWGPFNKIKAIDFSLDEAKPVTYILGYNSAGKTMIFNAIYWCLFNIPTSEELKFFINVEALKNNEKETYVRLKLHHIDNYGNRTNYDITRRLRFEAGRNDEGQIVPKAMMPEFIVNKTLQGSSMPELVDSEEFSTLMDNLVPPGPRPFFFLNGEKLASLFTRENFKKLEAYANAISDVGLIDKIIAKLDETYDDLNEKSSKSSKISDDIKRDQKDLEEKKRQKSEAEKWKTQLEGQIEVNRSLSEKLNRECSKYEELIPRLERIKSNEAEKKQNQLLREEKCKEFKEFLNDNLYLLLVEHELDWCKNELSRLETEEEIPPKKTPIDVIDSILESNPPMCICGREINAEIKARFEAIKNQIPDKKLNKTIESFRFELASAEKKMSSNLNLLGRKIEDIKRINITINSLQTKIDSDRTDDLKALEKTNILDIFKKSREVGLETTDLEGQLSRANDKVTVLSREEKTIKQKLESKMEKDCAMKEIGKKMIFIRDSIEAMEAVKNLVKESTIKHVKEFTSDGFRKLVWDPSNWKEISITDDWAVSAISSKNDKFPCFSLSEGQRHVLGIAFMSSLGKVTGNAIPFVFDSPFGRISEEPIKNIGKNIHVLMEGRQVILLVTDTESANIRKHIDSIIGKEYIIEKISATESIINGD